MPATRTSVLIVEDHRVVAEGLAELINDHEDMTAVGTTASVTGAVALTADLKPDVVLMDFCLSDGTGSVAGQRIRQLCPDAKLLFLTRDDGYAARIAALEAGASGFIHKSRAAQEVIDAIRAVANGESLYTPTAIADLLKRRREVKAHVRTLTRRETEVLQLMAKGNASRGIACQLGISYATVRSHIRSLADKLGVHSKVEAIAKAHELALVSSGASSHMD